MRTLTLAAVVLMGSVCPTFSMPAANQLLGDEHAACCCCDISQGVISCTNSTFALLCSCLDVACPEGAPTVWYELPLPEPTTEPSPPEEEVECCCCDISQPAISCKKQPADEGCICPLVLCPSDAPTVYPESKPTATPTPTPAPEPTPPDDNDANEEDMVPCCCCDISKPAISCKMQAESEGCICGMVICPSDAPTVWPEGPPTPTLSLV